jgi:hypothetical protein
MAHHLSPLAYRVLRYAQNWVEQGIHHCELLSVPGMSIRLAHGVVKCADGRIQQSSPIRRLDKVGLP